MLIQVSIQFYECMEEQEIVQPQEKLSSRNAFCKK